MTRTKSKEQLQTANYSQGLEEIVTLEIVHYTCTTMTPKIIYNKIQDAFQQVLLHCTRLYYTRLYQTILYCTIWCSKPVANQTMRIQEQRRVRSPTATRITNIRPTASATISFLNPRKLSIASGISSLIRKSEIVKGKAAEQPSYF